MERSYVVKIVLESGVEMERRVEAEHLAVAVARAVASIMVGVEEHLKIKDVSWIEKVN